MAITNASDLLVYAKTTDSVKQITRIRVLDTLPLVDFETLQELTLSNVTNASGAVFDDIPDAISNNNGDSVVGSIAAQLVQNYGYQYTDGFQTKTDGNYKYLDVTNGATGIVPTLQITSGTATLADNAVVISIETPGSSEVFDPVSFGTNASFSSTVETRDITHKDSGGFTEVMSSTKSFEISSESLQSINPDTPLDGTDFFHELKERDKVKLAFSDRIRNIIRTNLTQSGVDGFSIFFAAQVEQTNLQPDPFGGNKASKIKIVTTTTFNGLQYSIPSSRIEDRFVTWTFYVKGDPNSPNNDEATFYANNGSDLPISSVEILSGDGNISNLTSSSVKKINGLNTGANNVASNWTRVRVTYNVQGGSANQNTDFKLVPGSANAQVANDIIYVSSWQIEFSDQATDYQDPTTIKSFQGEALVTSVNYDAGVEDNLTCSATFTGTGDIFINGLGPELIGDTQFDLGTVGTDTGAYWNKSSTSIIENGYGKIIATNQDTSIFKDGILIQGDTYLLTYRVHDNGSNSGNIAIDDAYSTTNILVLPKTPGQTHKVVFVAADPDLVITNASDTGTTNIWLSSISLKKFF